MYFVSYIYIYFFTKNNSMKGKNFVIKLYKYFLIYILTSMFLTKKHILLNIFLKFISTFDAHANPYFYE